MSYLLSWFVILGDPGSGKTSLLRWITWIYAQAAYSRHEQLIFAKDCHSLVRIPILIRLGEFAIWFEQNPQKTLIDYIGKHTWFSQIYCHDNNEIVFKELIDHGHALILIDGLDEVFEIRHKQMIVDVVQKFVDEHIVGSDFLSTSDDFIFKNLSKYCYQSLTETSSPSKHNGNQVIVTSRYIGYHINPLNSVFIRHYLLSLIDHEESKMFVQQWMIQVEKGIVDVLINEGIQIDEELIENISKKRTHIIKNMFENNFEYLLSNPSLLSLICMFMLESSNNTQFKSRVQLYDYAVQITFTDDKCHELGISKTLLYKFLINLAVHLHLQSTSGLIDEFDMEHLSYFTLRQQNISNNRNELHQITKQLITLLKSNNCIVDERGLQIFGFLHLSFQEYFVSQAFVQMNSSIEDLVEHILTFIINPRFRQSLLMALDWISWKWSLNNYDQFCKLLLTLNHNYSIPFGTLLFFDAINDMQILPSNSIIYIALNNLLDHPYDILAKFYFISSLSKLKEDVIIEWMKLYLVDEKRLLVFCKCLYMTRHQSSNIQKINSESVISLIYQQLPSFSNISLSSEFIIDQIFRRSKNLHNELSSNNISVSDIHPLILSVLIAVCGGVYFEYENFIVTPKFSLNNFHHKSSIMEYFIHNNESYSIKIDTLIKQYENILERTSTLDTSVDIVDTFMAFICLKGLSKPLMYQEYLAFSLALDRLKRIWFYLKQPFETRYFKYYTVDTSSILTSNVESIIKTYSTQTHLSKQECIVLSLACSSALNKLCTGCSLASIPFDISLINNSKRSLGSPPDLSHFAGNKQYQISNNIHLMKMFQKESYFLLTFVPQSLQKLYYCMITDVTNEMYSSSFVIFLSQCLILLENVCNYDPDFDRTLSMLQSELNQYKLENYSLMLTYKYSCNQLKDYDKYINIERQRISDMKDLQLFSTSITLAKIFQCRTNEFNKNRILSSIESEEVNLIISNISDPILRIIALSFVLTMEKPLIFDEEKSDELKFEMINMLQSVLPTLPLLISTLLFIRCYTARPLFPQLFHQMADIIGRKLNEINIVNDIHEAIFIALHHLNDPDLSHYLFKSIKQTKANLSDLLQFNSSVFFQYFSNQKTFNIENSFLLSIMYLTELAFDGQNLKMINTENCKDKTISLKQWKQLWSKSSIDRNRMTSKMATWITNYLTSSSRTLIYEIIEDISHCLMIDKKAVSVIEKWLDYRTEKYLKFFAHYAALQLLIEGFNTPVLLDIITEILNTDKTFYFISFIQNLFNSELIHLTTLHQILIRLNQNIHYSSEISLWIHRKEILELVLSLELERTISKTYPSSPFLINSFLSIIVINSDDLQYYLRTFINEQNKVKYIFNEDFIAVLRTLYNWDNHLSNAYTKEVADCRTSYLFDPEPDYIDIVWNLMNTNFNSFFSAIRRSCFKEDQFKKQLYLYYMKHPRHSTIVVRFYAAFGVLTVELIEMLTWINDTSSDATWQYLKDIKQVSDREVIEKLFEQIDLNLYNNKLEFFTSILKIIIQLAQVHVVSSLEVHQRLSSILNCLLCDENSEEWSGFHNIISCLLSLSCIEQVSPFNHELELFAENDVEEDFKQTIQIEQLKSSLFLRRDYFSGFFQ
ncbi:hypothetical protein I4U23_016053 [Adineta vaga]|nr:hypothetical protein I4U23_016053 [Adineta vaga]